jgi:hypothetical protein
MARISHSRPSFPRQRTAVRNIFESAFVTCHDLRLDYFNDFHPQLQGSEIFPIVIPATAGIAFERR